MKKQYNKHSRLWVRALLLSGMACAFLPLNATEVMAQRKWERPALTITNDPLPSELKNRVYSQPVEVPAINPRQITGAAYFNNMETTAVGQKVMSLSKELQNLQSTVQSLSTKLTSYERAGQDQSAQYYADIATINTQLQTGTTPGNPRLVGRLTNAQQNLEALANNIANLNNVSMEINHAATTATYLLQSIDSTYHLQGAIEEDHVNLSKLEDNINGLIVIIDRLANNVSDDITRTMAYVSAERDNLRVLSMAVNEGDLFGPSLVQKHFSNGEAMGSAALNGTSYAGPNLSGARPLIKIRFDSDSVSYQQPLYLAVNEAVSRFPNANFSLVAVHPTQGNAAQVAIESTKARRNAERVLRSMSEMGVPVEQIEMSYAPGGNVTSNEVHLYIR